MHAAEEEIEGFTFYSLSDCTHQQLLSHSKYEVNIYHHTEDRQVFVVKEVPFSYRKLEIYRVLNRHPIDNLVQLRGLTKYSFRSMKEEKRLKKQMLPQYDEESFGPYKVTRAITSKEFDGQDYSANYERYSEEQIHAGEYLLVWMEKYEMNLYEYVESRRRAHKLFSCEEVKGFLMQMLHTLNYLQHRGVCLRDIKPQNILYHKGRYLFCDFDEAMVNLNSTNRQDSPRKETPKVEYTTILYTSPKFLKALKEGDYRTKYFDPFKMDVYALGLTLLHFCSMGKFNIEDRHVYIYNSGEAHSDFINEERRKYVKKNPELKVFNNLIKLMLEEDEWKRDDFQTLSLKMRELFGDEQDSEPSFSEYSRTTKQMKRKQQKLRRSNGKGFVCGKFNNRERFLCTAGFLVFAFYALILIFSF